MTRKRVKEDRSVANRFQLKIDPARQREIAGLALFALGGLVLLSLLRIAPSAISNYAAQLLRVMFGWGAFGLPLLAFIGSGFLLRRGDHRATGVAWGRVFAAEIFSGAALALVHLFTPADNPAALADKGEGGGFIGYTISNALVAVIGEVGAGLILFALVLFTLPAIIGLSAGHLRAWSETLKARAAQTKPAPAVAATPRPRVERPRPMIAEPEDWPLPAAPPTRPVFGKPAPAVAETARLTHPILSARKSARRRAGALPALDLLAESNEAKYGELDAKRKSELIVEALANFGIPAKIIEINAGPTVTQFGLEPGFLERRGTDGQMRRRKVSVSRIAALQHDLELALAAAPIRIETPVPGRPIVGIEVPNQSVSVVSLRGVLESEQFKKKKGALRVALGRDVSGASMSADMGSMPHLLIAGATGSGKSVCINTIIACLLFNNSPDDLRLILVDPKRVELTTFNNIPHLLGPVVVNMDEVVSALRWVVEEMDSRFTLFAKTGVRNVEAYNAQATENSMPYIVVLIDELADLMLAAPDETEKLLTRLAQMARATGIHLVIATQRPSVDVVTGLIKANFPARIAFAVTSGVDSRVVLDTPGAEKLLGRGDMLYMAPDSSKLLRLQGCFVADEELARLVHFWREKAIMEMRDIIHEPPWKALEESGKNGGGDQLVEKATQLVRQADTASISFLQRKLGIGYPRAARLMDQLEELGVVSADEGGGKARAVIPPEPPEPGRSKKKK
ncbi:MAG: DNA translocase FtsK 4TM domain-containing protein [Chloroflexi bacterium]|nr:DNA translocase FtsK 4TM domain-containing protein [Chloroflexota bacterium]